MWCAAVDDTEFVADALMYPVQLYCTMVDYPVDADASICMTSAPVFERENVRELVVETVDEEWLDVEDDDDVTVITMFPDPDRVDHSDEDTIGYPSSDEDEDVYTDDEDDESTYYDDEIEEEYPWSTLTDSVRYDLEHPPEEDEFSDAVEVEEVPTMHKGIEYFDATAPPICSYVWFRPRPSPWWYVWLTVAKITAF